MNPREVAEAVRERCARACEGAECGTRAGAIAETIRALDLSDLASQPDAEAKCGLPSPGASGRFCDQPRGHGGSHAVKLFGISWQDAPPTPAEKPATEHPKSNAVQVLIQRGQIVALRAQLAETKRHVEEGAALLREEKASHAETIGLLQKSDARFAEAERENKALVTMHTACGNLTADLARVTAALETSERDRERLRAQQDQAIKDWTALRAERDALAKFKSYVHQRLDEAGIPANPQPPKHALHGCRVGDRLDALAQERDRLKNVVTKVARDCRGWSCSADDHFGEMARRLDAALGPSPAKADAMRGKKAESITLDEPSPAEAVKATWPCDCRCHTRKDTR